MHVARLSIALSVFVGLQALAADAPGVAFDGRWEVQLTCPPHRDEVDGAKGYTHRWPAQVSNGFLRGTFGAEGQPGWHLLRGDIAADGRAVFKLEGIVSNEEYAVNNATRGKPYTYRVQARFEGASGSGQRVGQRKCEFRFTRSAS